MASNQSVEVTGRVVSVQEPTLNEDTNNWRPGKLVLDTSEHGEVEIACFPVRLDTVPPGTMPTVWQKLDRATIVGKMVRVTASPDKSYNGKSQFKAPTNVEVLEAPQGQAPAAPPAMSQEIQPNQLRIMLQNAMGHATHAYANWLSLNPETRGSFISYLRQIAIGATWILTDVYQPVGYRDEGEPLFDDEPFSAVIEA